jgi:hypothetical protein
MRMSAKKRAHALHEPLFRTLRVLTYYRLDSSSRIFNCSDSETYFHLMRLPTQKPVTSSKDEPPKSSAELDRILA